MDMMKIGLFFKKSINLYKAYSLKDNPLINQVHLNNNIQITPDLYYCFENMLSDKDFFKLIDNINNNPDSSTHINGHIIKLLAEKLNEINTLSFNDQRYIKKNRKVFLDSFETDEIDKIKSLIFYFKKNEHLLDKYKKDILKYCSSVHGFFAKKTTDDENYFPEYNDIVFSFLKTDDDFKYTFSVNNRIYLGLPNQYMIRYYHDGDDESQKEYQKEILKRQTPMDFYSIFFDIHKENLPLLYKSMTSFYNKMADMKGKYDFSGTLIDIGAFSHIEFVRKVLSKDKLVSDILNFRYNKDETKKDPTKELFNFIFKSFLRPNQTFNTDTKAEFLNIVRLLKKHTDNNSEKFMAIFYNAFHTNISTNIPEDYSRVNELLNIIYKEDPELIKKISFNADCSLGNINYLETLNDDFMTQPTIWFNCNWQLYRSGLETNFYNTLDKNTAIKFSKDRGLDSFFPLSNPEQLKEAVEFISQFNGNEYSKICMNVLKDFDIQKPYIIGKDEILSQFSWTNEIEKLNILTAHINDNFSYQQLANKCIHYYSSLLNDSELTIEPLKDYFPDNKIQESITSFEISDRVPFSESISKNTFFQNYISLLNPKDIDGDVNKIKAVLLKTGSAQDVLNNHKLWQEDKWQDNNKEFRKVLFIAVEKSVLNINLEQEAIQQTLLQKNRKRI